MNKKTVKRIEKRKSLHQPEVSNTIIVEKKPILKILFLPFVGSFLVATIAFTLLFSSIPAKTQQKSAKKMPIPTPTHIPFRINTNYPLDPFMLVQALGKKQGVTIIDLRTQKEFDKEHILTAVNVPAKEGSTEYKDVRKTIDAVKVKQPVILYQDTTYSVEPKIISQQLKKEGYEAVELAIGWNEWRHFTTMWLPESQWDTVSIDKFVESSFK